MEEAQKIALVVEEDDKAFQKVLKCLKNRDFQVERSRDYSHALVLLKAKEYKKIVFTIILTDKDSFEFLGKVKELPYHHPNLLIQATDLLSEQEKLNSFDALLGSQEMREEIDQICRSDFNELKVKDSQQNSSSYLKISKKNPLPFEKVYIFQVLPEKILLGLHGSSQKLDHDNKLIIEVCIKGVAEEIILNGKYTEAEPFDANFGEILYLAFQPVQEGQKRWKQCLELFNSEELLLEELLINVRGF